MLRFRHEFRVLPAMLALLSLAACGLGPERAPPAGPGRPWLATHGLEHPLAGRLWDVGAGRFVTPAAVVAAFEGADYVLLGEKHDNPDHQRIQAWLVARLVEGGRRPALAFEMLTGAQEDRLRAHLAAHPGDAAGIGPAVAWDATGWPLWSSYLPIAEAGLRAGAPILAAGLPKARLRRVAREGVEALGREAVMRLGLDVGLPPAAEDRLRRSIVEGHCNQLPEDMVAPMATMQRVKDARMADALIAGRGAGGPDVAVLVAGAGHVRRDFAVPWHLARLRPGSRTLSLALAEVHLDETDLAPHLAAWDVDPPPFDFLWFTPRVDAADPCERYAEQLRGMRGRHGGKKRE